MPTSARAARNLRSALARRAQSRALAGLAACRSAASSRWCAQHRPRALAGSALFPPRGRERRRDENRIATGTTRGRRCPRPTRRAGEQERDRADAANARADAGEVELARLHAELVHARRGSPRVPANGGASSRLPLPGSGPLRALMHLVRSGRSVTSPDVASTRCGPNSAARPLAGKRTMAFTLPPLPYAKDALAPSSRPRRSTTTTASTTRRTSTTSTSSSPGRDVACEKSRSKSIIDAGQRGDGLQQLRAGLEPHVLLELRWRRRRGGEPTGAIADAIDKAFGSFADFKKKFSKPRSAQFGSGWAWLVKDGDGSLAIETTHERGARRSPTGKTRAAHVRRLGARVLHRLPQRAPEVRRSVLEARELGPRTQAAMISIVRSTRGRARQAAAHALHHPEPQGALSSAHA